MYHVPDAGLRKILIVGLVPFWHGSCGSFLSLTLVIGPPLPAPESKDEGNHGMRWLRSHGAQRRCPLQS